MIEGNSREHYEVIYDNYSDIEDVDLSSYILNPHNQSQIILENVEELNTKIVLIDSHFQTSNYLHDFNVQEFVSVYDSYDD